MSDWAYYIVRSGGRVLGRHALAWPTECPPGVWRPLHARWYKAFPDATIERDLDQRSKDTGVWVRNFDEAKRMSDMRTLVRKLLRKGSVDEIHLLVDELAT